MSELTFPRFNLQLFADGAASAGAAASGEGGTQSGASQGDPYSALNVPDKARHILDKMPKAEVNGTQAGSKNTQSEESQESETEEPPARKSFEEILKSAEYAEEGQKYIDKLMGKRLAKFKDYDTMRELLDKVNLRYGVDSESKDYLTNLSNAIDGDTKLLEDEASEAGMTVENFRAVKNAELVMKQNERFQQERAQEEMTRNHVSNLIAQSEKFKEQFPSFNLEAEIANPQFKRLVDPPQFGGSGLPVDQAYFALHHKEIMQQSLQNAVNQAVAKTANSIQTNKGRPAESGANNGTTSNITKLDPSKLTLEDFKKIQEDYRRTGKKPNF